MASREKLTNMDQVICAVAYDNARHVLKRWVGERNPNGDDVFSWRRTHSNGDQASGKPKTQNPNPEPPNPKP